MQMQPFAQVLSVSGLCNEHGPNSIQPAQRFLPQRIDKEDLFKIENTLPFKRNLASDADEFLCPFANQPSFEYEYGRIVIRLW